MAFVAQVLSRYTCMVVVYCIGHIQNIFMVTEVLWDRAYVASPEDAGRCKKPNAV
jgi:hypothetical protein